jgi:hypothetical protein
MFESIRAAAKAMISPVTLSENDAKVTQIVFIIGETNVATLRTELVEKKCDVNAVSDDGWSILATVINLYLDDPDIEEKIKILIDLGADPNAGGVSEFGPGPVLTLADTRLVKLLLTLGADPNILVQDYSSLGDYGYKTIYEDFYTSYLIEVWDQNPPKEGRPRAQGNADEWLEYLDLAALAHKKIRPESLKLLRQHGGKTMPEYLDSLKVRSR